MSSKSEKPLLILGNGEHQVGAVEPDHIVITFNGAYGDGRFSRHIEVLNAARSPSGEHRLKLITHAKELDSWITELETTLSSSSKSGQEELGVLPSTGFLIVHALWNRHTSVDIAGMSFDPSLRRPQSLGNRTPLPQMFHNWLGERRASFDRWIRSPKRGWSWPLMNSPDAQGSSGPPRDHRELLDALRVARTTGRMDCLLGLSKSTISPDEALLKGSSETLELEQYFHLERGKRETTNWWLYDADGSGVIDRLANQLRQAQQQAFAKAMSRSPAVG